MVLCFTHLNWLVVHPLNVFYVINSLLCVILCVSFFLVLLSYGIGSYKCTNSLSSKRY